MNAEKTFIEARPDHQVFLKNMSDRKLCGLSGLDLHIPNSKANFKLIKKHGSVDELEGLAGDKAVILVGASPALKYNVKELENCDESFMIIAVNSSLKMLLKNNIKPHIVVVSDADPILQERDLTVDEDLSNVMLIATTFVSPKVLKAWKGPIKFIPMKCNDKKTDKKTLKALGVDKHFEGAGNALGMAANIAMCVLGSRTIIFIGNELCLPNGEYYCDDKKHADTSGQWSAIDIFQKEVKTTAPLYLYKTYLEDLASHGVKEGIVFVNATQAGIFGINAKDGFLPFIWQIDLRKMIVKWKEATSLCKSPLEAEKIKYDLSYSGSNYVNYSHSSDCAEKIAKLGQNILEVGCGDGRGVRKLVEMGRNAEGCDISTNVKKYWDGIEHLCIGGVTAWDLPYGDNSFDVISACDVMEHIPPNFLFEVMDEFARVASKLFLKIAFAPSGEKIKGRIEPHLSIYPPTYWKDFLIENGWDVDWDGGQIFICNKRRE